METLLPLLKWLEFAILFLLIGLSIWSVSVIFDRRNAFRQARHPLNATPPQQMIRAQDWTKLNDSLSQQKSLLNAMLGLLMHLPVTENDLQEKAIRSFLLEERQKLEKGLNVLATLGANAPFIGLFGTVLGIIQAFAALSVQEAGSTTVMSSIANALVATAAGLFVAIPAVVAFNVFTGKLRDLLNEAESVKELYFAYRHTSSAAKKDSKNG